MKEVEEELDPERFLRIHRSRMVAVDRILSIRTTSQEPTCSSFGTGPPAE